MHQIFKSKEVKHRKIGWANNRENGFTLIELLVVLSIISILATIVMPQISIFRQRAYDVRAQSDLRNLAIAEEAYYLDSERYLACENKNCTSLPGLARLSPGVLANVKLKGNEFIATTSHPKGSVKSYVWDSEEGGINSNETR